MDVRIFVKTVFEKGETQTHDVGHICRTLEGVEKAWGSSCSELSFITLPSKTVALTVATRCAPCGTIASAASFPFERWRFR